jgi:hypothetical protein
MPNRIRIIRHQPVPKSGSFEVRFSDGRESKFFYFDDILARRLRPDILTSDQALEQAKAFARAERDRGGRGRCHGWRCCLKPVKIHPTNQPKKYRKPLTMAVPVAPIPSAARYCAQDFAELSLFVSLKRIGNGAVVFPAQKDVIAALAIAGLPKFCLGSDVPGAGALA